jgi:hypothetical protein
MKPKRPQLNIGDGLKHTPTSPKPGKTQICLQPDCLIVGRVEGFRELLIVELGNGVDFRT